MSLDEHALFEAEAYYESFLHKKGQGFRIYPGMVREAE